MATIGYQGVAVCAGGDHVTVAVSINGGAAQNVTYTADDLLAPLSDLSADDRQLIALTILKLHCAGMTRNQAKVALQAGITVTL